MKISKHALPLLIGGALAHAQAPAPQPGAPPPGIRTAATGAAAVPSAASPASAPGAAPHLPAAEVQKKPPRKFLIDGRLRPLKPGEIRPYVPPELPPDPEPEPCEFKVVEVIDEDESQVLARPYYGAPMVGNLALGARVPVRGTFTAKSSRYCPTHRWYALAPAGWICSRQARPVDRPPSETPVLVVPPGERLPFRYVMVSSKDPLPMWGSVEDFKEGRDPERMLEKGDSVAVEKIIKHDGESFHVSVEGKVLPQKGTYAMGQGSEWRGISLHEKMHFPFGWTRPDQTKLYDTSEPGRKVVETLPRRTRVDILEEVEVAKKRYLRIRVAAALVAPAPAFSAPPAPPPQGGGAPGAVPPQGPPLDDNDGSRWVLSSDVNEVRLRAPPDGSRPDAPWIDVDLGEQVLTAYEGTRPVFATLISSGRAVPTPMGNYPVWAKVSAITMKSQPYDDKAYFVNKVPWSLFFQAHNAIHGAYWHDRFGIPKSHGCVNVAPLDARHLFEWLRPQLPNGWSAIRPIDLRDSPVVHIRNSSLRKPFVQQRPIGPPDREEEAERLDLAEKRRAEEAAAQVVKDAAAGALSSGVSSQPVATPTVPPAGTPPALAPAPAAPAPPSGPLR